MLKFKFKLCMAYPLFNHLYSSLHFMNRQVIKLNRLHHIISQNQLSVSSDINPENRYVFQESKFTNAMRLLEESYFPPQINCRDEQIKKLQEYLLQNIALEGCSKSLYISGVPGIGKTLCVKEVARRICEEKAQEAMYIYTNALTLKKRQDIYKVIYFQMTKKIMDPSSALIHLNQYFQKGKQLPNAFYPKLKRKKILIIDEIDYLKSRDEDVLYNIFQWTQKKKSNLIIIAISNTLDFPLTLIPKIASRFGKSQLAFTHYNSQQIYKIIMQRIQNQQIFDEQALKYISKKIAGSSSDIRKCLYILRQTINNHLIIQFEKGKNQGKNGKQKRDKNQQKISIDLLVKVHQHIYKDNFSLSFKDFPPSYKIILYCLAKYYRGETKTCTIRQLQSLLGNFVKSQSQLRPILTDLKELGLISIKFQSLQKQSKTFLHFDNLTFLKEQNINLLIDPDKIVVALQKQDLNQIDFNINLNF